MLLEYLSTFFSYKISHVQSPIFFSVQVRSAKTSALSKLFSFIQINFFLSHFLCSTLYFSNHNFLYLRPSKKKKKNFLYLLLIFFFPF